MDIFFDRLQKQCRCASSFREKLTTQDSATRDAGRSQVRKAINHVLHAMQEHHMDCAVQEAALRALLALGCSQANLMRINGAGGRAKVSVATAASNATDETKACGKKLDDKLKAAEETEKKAEEERAEKQAKHQALISQVNFMLRLAQV